MRHYLINTVDIRICPNDKCGYAGIVDINANTERIECTQPLACSKCETTWRDPLQREPFSFLAILKGLIPLDYESFANNLRKILIAEPCPNCGVMIQKNSGCPHMVCAKCKYEFCWTCLGHYKRYRHDIGMTKYCGQSVTVWFMLYFLFGFIILMKVLKLPFFT